MILSFWFCGAPGRSRKSPEKRERSVFGHAVVFGCHGHLARVFRALAGRQWHPCNTARFFRGGNFFAPRTGPCYPKQFSAESPGKNGQTRRVARRRAGKNGRRDTGLNRPKAVRISGAGSHIGPVLSRVGPARIVRLRRRSKTTRFPAAGPVCRRAVSFGRPQMSRHRNRSFLQEKGASR